MNSNLTIMDKQTTQSTLTEEVSKNNDPKQVKAKQIFLGIDAHLARNQVARKKDKGDIQAVQSLSFEELLLFAQKQLSLAEEVYAVYEAGRWATCSIGVSSNLRTGVN